MDGLKQAAGAALVGLVVSGSAGGETLDQAIAAARAGPRMIVARATYRESVASAKVAIASSRPNIVFNATATRNFDSDVYGPRLRDQLTFQVGVPLYAGGRIRAGRAAGRASERAGHAAFDAEEARLVVDVTDVYTAVQEARELRVVAAEQVQRLSSFQQRIEAEQRAGAVDGTDRAEGTARLAAARRDLVDAERRLSIAEERYRELVGRAPGERLEMVAPALPFDAASAAKAVQRDNAELRSLYYSVEEAAHNVEAERGYGRPSLNIIGSGSYGDTGTGLVNNNPFMLTPNGALEQVASPRRFPHRFTARGLLVLQIPFYSGRGVSARVARAQASRTEAEARVAERERAIVAEVRDAVWRSRSATTDAILADAAVDAGRDALKGVDIARSIGERTELDVLNAARELAEAQTRRAYAKREAAMQAVLVLADTGRLGDAVSQTSARSEEHTAQLAPATIRFDLAALPGSHREGGRSSIATPRPLRYDLSGLG